MTTGGYRARAAIPEDIERRGRFTSAEKMDVLLNAGIFVRFFCWAELGASVPSILVGIGTHSIHLHPLWCATVWWKLLAAGAVQADGPAGR